ncbi:hypothetical protein [Streptomyces sp. NPDC047990]
MTPTPGTGRERQARARARGLPDTREALDGPIAAARTHRDPRRSAA